MIECERCEIEFLTGDAYNRHLISIHQDTESQTDDRLIKDEYPKVARVFALSVGPGWIDVFARHCSDLSNIVKSWPDSRIIFKNKFGRPRFNNPQKAVPEYYKGHLKDILHRIRNTCLSTCEICGKEGERRKMQVTCGQHHDKRMIYKTWAFPKNTSMKQRRYVMRWTWH